MRKILATISALVTVVTANAQSIELGLRGGVDSFWLLNSNTSAASTKENKTISISYNGGLHLAFDITDNIGIETNVMYAALSQTYSGTFNNSGILPNGDIYLKGESYTSKTALTETQIPLLLCLETNSGSFVELGAEYDMINGATYTGNFSNPSENQGYSTANYFAKSNIAGVFGFGGKYSITDYFFLLTDFRVTYGFTDIRGVDGVGQDYNSSPYYSTPKPTTAFNASFNIGAFFLIPANKGYRVGHKCKGTPQVRSGTSHPR